MPASSIGTNSGVHSSAATSNGGANGDDVLVGHCAIGGL